MNSVSKNIDIKICQYNVWCAEFYMCHLLIALPQHQWLYERTSVLRYTHIAFLVTLFPGYKFQIPVLKFRI